MKQLVKAVLGVMEDCVGIEKNMTIGSGYNSYKGLADKDVKLKVGEAMRKHKLIILPTDIIPVNNIERWQEVDSYSKETPKAMKTKQSVFCEVLTKYQLIHESGESIELAGYGHGTDPQDKSAGKATTYAMKYTLLYSFMVATGHIEDTDNQHSDAIPTKPVKPVLNSKHKHWKAIAMRLGADITIEKVKESYDMTAAVEKALIKLSNSDGK